MRCNRTLWRIHPRRSSHVRHGLLGHSQVTQVLKTLANQTKAVDTEVRNLQPEMVKLG